MPLKPQQQILATTPHVLTAAPFAPVRPLAPGLPYEERKGERYQLTGLFLFFLDPIIIFFFLLLNEVNDNSYSQEVQRGQKDLGGPLHHGDPRGQQDQGYQQVQFHPKRGIDTRTLASK